LLAVISPDVVDGHRCYNYQRLGDGEGVDQKAHSLFRQFRRMRCFSAFTIQPDEHGKYGDVDSDGCFMSVRGIHYLFDVLLRLAFYFLNF
jgi:hypothetical protein